MCLKRCGTHVIVWKAAKYCPCLSSPPTPPSCSWPNWQAPFLLLRNVYGDGNDTLFEQMYIDTTLKINVIISLHIKKTLDNIIMHIFINGENVLKTLTALSTISQYFWKQTRNADSKIYDLCSVLGSTAKHFKFLLYYPRCHANARRMPELYGHIALGTAVCVNWYTFTSLKQCYKGKKVMNVIRWILQIDYY